MPTNLLNKMNILPIAIAGCAVTLTMASMGIAAFRNMENADHAWDGQRAGMAPYGMMDRAGAPFHQPGERNDGAFDDDDFRSESTPPAPMPMQAPLRSSMQPPMQSPLLGGGAPGYTMPGGYTNTLPGSGATVGTGSADLDNGYWERQRSQDQRAQAFDGYINDTTTVKDTETGEIHSDVSNDIANPAIESGAATEVATSDLPTSVDSYASSASSGADTSSASVADTSSSVADTSSSTASE